MYDVAVVGLGVMGAMALWQVTQHAPGARVIGIDRFAPGHDRGASHGGSRIFRRTVFEAPHYVPLVARAQQLWDNLEAASGTRLRTVTGGLSIGTDGGAFLADAQQAAKDGGVPVELLDCADLRHRFPQHAVFDDDCAVHEPGAGVLDPEGCVRAAVEVATSTSAELITGAAVTAIRPVSSRAGSAAHVEVVTGTTIVRARRVIVAAGAWVTRLLPEENLPIRVQRTVPVHFRPSASEATAFAPERFPVFIRESHHLNAWGIGNVDGRGVKIGVKNFPKPWLRRVEDNWVPPRPSDLAPAVDACHELLPQLRGATADGFPCMNAKTPDTDFIIGHATATPGVVILAGFGGQGFKYSAAVGDVGARLALEQDPAIDLTAFRPDRFPRDRDPWSTPAEPVFDPAPDSEPSHAHLAPSTKKA